MPRLIDFNCATLVGKTFTKITETGDYNNELVFEEADGTTYTMYHEQDCCESVSIEEIVGDLEDLINTPILEFREDTNNENPRSETHSGITLTGKPYSNTYVDESCTWTFYNIRTIKGSVTIRWYGSSNGYYSENVDWKTNR